jgi:dTMP kinase
MSRGWFITFEGLDGSGKTTQIQRLAAWLEMHDHQVLVTRQPGGTPLGERIRKLLLSSCTEKSTGSIAPHAELALMFADRAQSIAELIEPALESGKVVLCDRFTDSTEAYQGGGRQLGSEPVLAVHQAVCGGLQPDLTVMLLPSLAASLLRARRRNQRTVLQQGADEGRFEQLDDDFHRRVYAAYKAIAAREPERVVLFENDDNIDEIHAKICAVVESRFSARVNL